MRNLYLEYTILNSLRRAERPLSHQRLGDEVSFLLEQPNLTEYQFQDSLTQLSKANLILKKISLLGTVRWMISDLGIRALDEFECRSNITQAVTPTKKGETVK